jgi:hypothetical protein
MNNNLNELVESQSYINEVFSANKQRFRIVSIEGKKLLSFICEYIFKVH